MKINNEEVHSSITLDRVMDVVQRGMETLDNPGLCIACGEDVDSCEPDARKYTCEVCGEPAVYGVEEILMMEVLS